MVQAAVMATRLDSSNSRGDAICRTFSRLQLADGSSQILDRDVQRLCSQQKITLPFCDALRLGLLLLFTLSQSKLVDSRKIVVELLRCVSVWAKSFRPHENECCDEWHVDISCFGMHLPVRAEPVVSWLCGGLARCRVPVSISFPVFCEL